MVVVNFLEPGFPFVAERVVVDEEDVAGEDVVADVVGAGRCHCERMRIAGYGVAVFRVRTRLCVVCGPSPGSVFYIAASRPVVGEILCQPRE